MKFKKESELPHSGGAFLKLKDGESVTGIFRGDVHEFFEKWEGKTKVIVAPEDGGKFRFRINFIVYEGGQFVSKIFEQGKTVYIQLGDLHEECDLRTTKVKITRKGSGMNDTAYAVVPVLKEPLTAKQIKEIDAVPLQELEHKAAEAAESKGYSPASHFDDAPPPTAEDEIPF